MREYNGLNSKIERERIFDNVKNIIRDVPDSVCYDCENRFSCDIYKSVLNEMPAACICETMINKCSNCMISGDCEVESIMRDKVEMDQYFGSSDELLEEPECKAYQNSLNMLNTENNNEFDNDSDNDEEDELDEDENHEDLEAIFTSGSADEFDNDSDNDEEDELDEDENHEDLEAIFTSGSADEFDNDSDNDEEEERDDFDLTPKVAASKFDNSAFNILESNYDKLSKSEQHLYDALNDGYTINGNIVNVSKDIVIRPLRSSKKENRLQEDLEQIISEFLHVRSLNKTVIFKIY